jgi:mannose-6-phosphate isomerase-like protein (cupin superfamily)
LPEVEGGRSVIYAEVSGAHGQSTIGARSRIYFILEGEGEYQINGEILSVKTGDVIVIPPQATYNFWPKTGTLKVLLYMELIDLTALSK